MMIEPSTHDVAVDVRTRANERTNERTDGRTDVCMHEWTTLFTGNVVVALLALVSLVAVVVTVLGVFTLAGWTLGRGTTSTIHTLVLSLFTVHVCLTLHRTWVNDI